MDIFRAATVRHGMGMAAGLLIAAAGPSFAGGSLPMTEVIELAAGHPALKQAIDDLLAAEGIAAADVVCTATRLGNHWRHLSAGRVLPYECDVGKRKLVIRGRIEFLDGAGKVIGTGDDNGKSLTKRVFRDAEDVRMSAPQWTVE